MSGPSSPSKASSRGERIIASGVRSSWVMLAKKRDLNSDWRRSSWWARCSSLVVSSSASCASSCARCARKPKICPVPAMPAVETRKARFITAVDRSPKRPMATFMATKVTTITAWVVITTRGGQTKSSPVATMASVRPA